MELVPGSASLARDFRKMKDEQASNKKYDIDPKQAARAMLFTTRRRHTEDRQGLKGAKRKQKVEGDHKCSTMWAGQSSSRINFVGRKQNHSKHGGETCVTRSMIFESADVDNKGKLFEGPGGSYCRPITLL